MKIHAEECDSRRLLRVEGELRLPDTECLRQALLDALATGRDTEMDLSVTEGIDLSGLQILESARRTFRNQHRELKMERAPGVIARAARLAGFTCIENTEGCNG